MFAAIRHGGGYVAAALALSSTGLFLLVPQPDVTDPILLAALAAIAGVAYSLKVWLEADSQGKGGLTFDATVIVVLVALHVGGPWPALLVWLVPDLIHRIVMRRAPLLSSGLALNFTGFALALLAATAALELLPGFAGLVLAGVAMVEINFLASGLLYAALFERAQDRRLLIAEHVGLTPITAVMVAIGAATALLAEQHGLAALVLLSFAVALPEIQWPKIAARLPAPPQPSGYAERIARVEREAAVTESIVAAMIGQLDAIAAGSVRDGGTERIVPSRAQRQRGDHA